MRTTKYVLFGALGVAALLLLTSDSAKKMRDGLDKKAMANAEKWKSRLSKMGSSAAGTLDELRELLSAEIEGLSDDARQRIENIVNGSTKSAAKLKRAANHMVS